MDVHELERLVRSGTPVRFTAEALRARENLSTDPLVVRSVYRRQQEHVTHRFMSRDDPEHFDIEWLEYWEVGYIPQAEVLEAKAAGRWLPFPHTVRVDAQGRLWNGLRQEPGPVAFKPARRPKRELNEKTFLLICGECGWVGEIGEDRVCCGRDLLRLSGTRRGLENFLREKG